MLHLPKQQFTFLQLAALIVIALAFICSTGLLMTGREIPDFFVQAAGGAVLFLFGLNTQVDKRNVPREPGVQRKEDNKLESED